MATTELTGAEDIAWDLGDLYSGPDDPELEEEITRAEEAGATFRERYRGEVASLDAPALAEAVAERERIESMIDRAGTYAHLLFATNMADPVRGALVTRLRERGAALDAELLFFSLEWAAVEDERAEAILADPTLDHWRHVLRALRKYRPYLLSEPEERIDTEKGVTGRSAWSRFYEEQLGALRVDRRRRGRRARDGDGPPVLVRPRRARGRRSGSHGGARARPAHAHVRLQHDPPRQVGRRSSARLPHLDHRAQPRERDNR